MGGTMPYGQTYTPKFKDHVDCDTFGRVYTAPIVPQLFGYKTAVNPKFSIGCN